MKPTTDEIISKLSRHCGFNSLFTCKDCFGYLCTLKGRLDVLEWLKEEENCDDYQFVNEEIAKIKEVLK